ncbi:Leucine-rich receptor-like protein kinase family protein [Tripterygium wilfordii]|uniref:Leucine-rich receptor-like protein kinase family protein n=1 Tax=Tripterygium wilfordii TaxID=458696 RepID=A0A7J7DMW7_TRIWF|nr:leucine-rich repeat receptor-like protein kinase PXC2 [Tripterygium wilfordii]KAF5747678.1 Leucine-rich receptor-like protein kinase family protein [Tripterygium wilfordii]
MLPGLLFCLLLAPVLVLPVRSLDPTLNDDVLGLIVFKAGLQDPEAKLQSWTEDDYSPCGWDGVTCDQSSNRVTQLSLNGFSLSGHIGRGLLRLQFLQILSLASNNFSGTIIPDLAHLWSLQVIDLSENSLSGSIPDELFRQCGSLRSVSFARNNLTGQIPVSLTSCSTLQAVNFSYNQISGQIYSALWYMRGIVSIDLSNNLLDGEIPEGIGSLYNLRVINLGKNRLSGRIPWDIGGCFVLESLDFSENYLSGGLPESMQKLNSCTSLILRGNSLIGEVPHWIGELTTIETLDFSANRFSGWIPDSLGKLTALKELNLSMNRLTGELPESMKSCFNLLVIDVSQNKLTGDLPSWISKMGLQNSVLFGETANTIGFLGDLLSLNLSKNQLLGSIPTNIGKLKSANVLDLSDNRLNGNIPSEIGGAVSLKELRLQKNFLSGKIPTQLENCSSLTTLILSQNNLTGPVPAAIANLSNLQLVDFSFNNLTGSLPKELTNLSHLLLFNVAHNHLQGELPLGGYFNTISPSSVSGNPSLCGSVVKRACPSVHPKPIVLNPNSSDSSNGSSSSFNHRRRKIVLSISVLIAIGAAAFIAVGLVVVTLLNIHVRSSMSRSAAALALSNGDDFSCSPTNDPNYGKLVMFTGDAEFVAGDHALLNKDCELGGGGFGIVYRAILRDGRSVAIKKLTVSGLIKSQEDFEREVKHLGKIRHHNLVGLDGYYWTPSLQLLIYEYISSGSLYRHLHDATGSNCLTWRQRFRVILGMAKGLAHLHQLNIIHYNLKSTNVLLDDSGEAKVGDFGLARLLPALDRCILSSKIQSALGYMAPEFACRTVKITEKCDVYGFGVLVLEVVTGKRPVEYMEDDVVVLCDMVRRALEDGRMEECVDERLQSNFPADEAIPVIKLGLICASQVPSNRPDMEEVVNILELIQSPSEGREELE